MVGKMLDPLNLKYGIGGRGLREYQLSQHFSTLQLLPSKLNRNGVIYEYDVLLST
jgi:hypothetical protein